MKTTTVRYLKHCTADVLGWVAEGECVEVLRRGVPVAVIHPRARPKRVTRPDFAARMRTIYGNRELPVTATELLEEARGPS